MDPCGIDNSGIFTSHAGYHTIQFCKALFSFQLAGLILVNRDEERKKLSSLWSFRKRPEVEPSEMSGGLNGTNVLLFYRVSEQSQSSAGAQSGVAGTAPVLRVRACGAHGLLCNNLERGGKSLEHQEQIPGVLLCFQSLGVE